MALLAGLTKEDVWVIISLFGLWLLFIHKQKAGFLIFIFSLLLFYYLVWVAIPGAAGKNHFALNYYSDFGSSPNFIVKNILFSPQKTLKILLQPDRIEYLKQLLLPLGFVSLFSPLYFVFLLPNLLINLLSNLSQFRQISFQYASTITPFLFISSFYGVRFIKKVISHDKLLIIYLLTMGILGAYLYGPLPGARTPNTDMMVKTQPDKKVIASYLTNIPQNLSVAATNNLGAHLSQRVSIYTLPLGLEKADIIAFLLGDPFAQPSPLAQQNLVKKLKDNQNYQLLFEKGNFIVFKRKVPL